MRRTVLASWAILGFASFTLPPSARGEAPAEIFVAIHEGIPTTWDGSPPVFAAVDGFTVPALAFVGVPAKLNARGIEIDRPSPFALIAEGPLKVPAGPYRLLLRSRNAARLIVDGAVLAETRVLRRNSSGHEPVPPENVPEDRRWHPLPPSDQERIVGWESDGREHRVVLQAVIGGKGLRNETGELLVALIGPDGLPRLIGNDLPLTDDAWFAYGDGERARLAALEAQRRRTASAVEDDYWANRHERARRHAVRTPRLAPPGDGNLIDRHLAGQFGTPLSDDAFYRRLALDTTGVIPGPLEVAAFLDDPSPDKRDRAIDAHLADARWADNWMGYWQDVLAENPGLLKPTLNNTGPFRRFLHQAFEDNLAIDRLVTELVRMEGSALGGGPAGFGLATQNDVPMAAKAHVLGKAFLAIEMKCARCHDAPFHPFAQEDLFAMAALLSGKPEAVPATSTVPLQPGGRRPGVTITLAAGDRVAPNWNLTEIASREAVDDELPPTATSRDRLAALITSPDNVRFAPVIVNRLWHRLMGRGLVEPVDDWDGDTRTRHPELLADLAREFMIHDYDLKHVARLVLSSRAYQSSAGTGPAQSVAVPSRRLMTAEQVLDSLFAAVGKPFRAEELCLDIDGRRPPSEFLNLGKPTRAWQLALPSNERDRPALALPVVTSLTDVLLAFGWRAARPDPITAREEAVTPLQPALLANGVVVNSRIARLSDDSAITELCLIDQPPEQLVQAVFMRVLSRPAKANEVARIVDYFDDTYQGRIVPGARKRPPMRASARRVSWSNHLDAEASVIQKHEEQIVRDGDPPTERLNTDFRERMEDVLWSLVNSPEFIFMP